VTHEFRAYVEAGWFEGPPSQFTFPDFSSVQGYNSAWFAPDSETYLNTYFSVITTAPVGGGTLRTKSRVYSDMAIPR
jgi:hypothetical protein